MALVVVRKYLAETEPFISYCYYGGRMYYRTHLCWRSARCYAECRGEDWHWGNIKDIAKKQSWLVII